MSFLPVTIKRWYDIHKHQQSPKPSLWMAYLLHKYTVIIFNIFALLLVMPSKPGVSMSSPAVYLKRHGNLHFSGARLQLVANSQVWTTNKVDELRHIIAQSIWLIVEPSSPLFYRYPWLPLHWNQKGCYRDTLTQTYVRMYTMEMQSQSER